jgi:hypothetical protein
VKNEYAKNNVLKRAPYLGYVTYEILPAGENK